MKRGITILLTTIILLSIAYYIGVQQELNILAPGKKIINDTGIGKETGSKVPVDEEGKPLTEKEQKIITEAGGGGGGSNNNNEEDNTQTQEECNEEQISYSIGNFQNTKTCTTYEEETCIETEYDCSAEITNYDQEIEGEFKIKFTHYYINQGEKTTINTETKSILLEAGNKGTIHKKTTINQTLSNEEIYCETEKEEAPKKTTC